MRNLRILKNLTGFDCFNDLRNYFDAETVFFASLEARNKICQLCSSSMMQKLFLSELKRNLETKKSHKFIVFNKHVGIHLQNKNSINFSRQFPHLMTEGYTS